VHTIPSPPSFDASWHDRLLRCTDHPNNRLHMIIIVYIRTAAKSDSLPSPSLVRKTMRTSSGGSRVWFRINVSVRFVGLSPSHRQVPFGFQSPVQSPVQSLFRSRQSPAFRQCSALSSSFSLFASFLPWRHLPLFCEFPKQRILCLEDILLPLNRRKERRAQPATAKHSRAPCRLPRISPTGGRPWVHLRESYRSMIWRP
jgi:hypothetical protein